VEGLPIQIGNFLLTFDTLKGKKMFFHSGAGPIQMWEEATVIMELEEV